MKRLIPVGYLDYLSFLSIKTSALMFFRPVKTLVFRDCLILFDCRVSLQIFAFTNPVWCMISSSEIFFE